MANKHCFYLLTCLVCSLQLLQAQEKNDSSLIHGVRSMFKIKFASDLGFEWEKRIGTHETINVFGGYSLGRQTDNYDLKNNGIITSPAVYAEYRNYYDLPKRIQKNKHTKNNDASFLFGRIEPVFAVSNQNTFNLLLMQGWGVQRSISRKILIGFHLGVIEHFYFDKPVTGGFNTVKLEPLRSLSVSFIF